MEAYAKQQGARIAALYVEVESGKRSDRPELARALAHAKRSKAGLCVAKLDRLSRNAAFLLQMQEAKVPIVCVDNPAANELTIGLLAVIAQHEAKAISDRTRAALAAAKARGTALGSTRPGHWDGREQARLTGAKKGATVSATVRSKAAVEAYSDLRPMMEELRAKGMSLQAIADELNKQGHTTRRGKPWNPVQVARVLERAGR